MDRHPDAAPADLRAHMIDAFRGGLAYAALALGVVGTASVLPLIVWGLVVRGFH